MRRMRWLHAMGQQLPEPVALCSRCNASHQIPADGALLLENIGTALRRQEWLLLIILLQIATQRWIRWSRSLKEAALPHGQREEGEQ